MDYNTLDVSEASLRKLEDHYRAHGDGPIKLTVTYDPKSKRNTAMNASNNAGRIASVMKRMGATHVESEILPIKDTGDVSKSYFSYKTYKAHAPEGCEHMGGIEDNKIEANYDYQFGCSQDMILAKQIARPKDLLGRDDRPVAGARRHVNWLPSYNDGAQNDLMVPTATEN